MIRRSQRIERNLEMRQCVGQVRLLRDGTIERHARAIEIGACLAGLFLVLLAILAWTPLCPAGVAGLHIAVTLVGLAGAWPLLRLGITGVCVETVFDVGAQELRQFRITARGRARPVLALPLNLVHSVHIHRGPPGRPARLVARDAAGTKIIIGSAPLAQLQRMHVEIVRALCAAPMRASKRIRVERPVSGLAMLA